MCSISTESHWISATSVLQQCWISTGTAKYLYCINYVAVWYLSWIWISVN